MQKGLPDGSDRVLPVARTLTFFQPGPELAPLRPEELAAATRLGLMPLQYQQLSSEQRLVITANVDTTRRLMQELGVSFVNIQALSADELDQLLQNAHAASYLVGGAGIPLNDLLACPTALRLTLLQNPCVVAELIQKEEATFAQLSSLSILELQAVLDAPKSKEAREILHLPSARSCSLS